MREPHPASLVDGLPGGVWLVELAPLSDGDDLVPALLTVFGAREAKLLEQVPSGPRDGFERLTEALELRETLVVMDNCEPLGIDGEHLAIVEPSATRLRMTAGMSSRLLGSRPVVGSSRKITSGRPTSDAARSSRRRMPPEYVFAVRSAASPRSNHASRTRARAFASRALTSSRRPIMTRFWVPVSVSSTEANCPVRPIRSRTFAGSRRTS